MDLTSCPVVTGLLSTPQARRARSRPFSPNQRMRSAAGQRARSPIVLIPTPASFAAVLGPTPHSMFTDRGSRKAASVPGGTTVTALGGWFFLVVFFPTSVAILAISLFVAT